MIRLYHFIHRFLYRLNHSPMAIVLLSFFATYFLLCPIIFVLMYADVLGVWWGILVLVYLTLLISCYAVIMKNRDRARLRYELGDEFFFKLYPGEKRKEMRRKERLKRERLKNERLKKAQKYNRDL